MSEMGKNVKKKWTSIKKLFQWKYFNSVKYYKTFNEKMNISKNGGKNVDFTLILEKVMFCREICYLWKWKEFLKIYIIFIVMMNFCTKRENK